MRDHDPSDPPTDHTGTTRSQEPVNEVPLALVKALHPNDRDRYTSLIRRKQRCAWREDEQDAYCDTRDAHANLNIRQTIKRHSAAYFPLRITKKA
jgi:hypothetical protein